jgi:methylenetetrahydrofolate reductase (NADPH)
LVFTPPTAVGPAAPPPHIHPLPDGNDPTGPGDAPAHFYTFGGVEATSQWVHNYLA